MILPSKTVDNGGDPKGGHVLTEERLILFTFQKILPEICHHPLLALRIISLGDRMRLTKKFDATHVLLTPHSFSQQILPTM